MQVSQPSASFFTPFGHWGKQPMAGQGWPPGGGAGGVQALPPPPQSQLQGGQVLPGAQPGQAQAQAQPPPPPPPPVPPPCWQTPERHGWPTWHGMPSGYQTQALAVSARQLAPSGCAAQPSVVPASLVVVPPPEQLQGGQGWPATQAWQVQALVVGVPPPTLPPLDAAPAPTQPQPQGGQLWPLGQVGHRQAQVPLSTQPASGRAPQSQAQGGQRCPGRHEAQAQVQLPPVAPPEPPEQSHSIGGQVLPAGQYSGLTQAQPLPSAAWAWQ